jgi:hypothetical protein
MKDFSKCFSVVALFAITIIAFGIMTCPEAEAQVGQATICDSVLDQSAYLCDVYCDRLGCDVGGVDSPACAKVLEAFASLTDDPRFYGCAEEGAVMSCGGLRRACDVGTDCPDGEHCIVDICTNDQVCVPD